MSLRFGFVLLVGLLVRFGFGWVWFVKVCGLGLGGVLRDVLVCGYGSLGLGDFAPGFGFICALSSVLCLRGVAVVGGVLYSSFDVCWCVGFVILVDLVFALLEFVVIGDRGFVLLVYLCDSGCLIADLRVVV